MRSWLSFPTGVCGIRFGAAVTVSGAPIVPISATGIKVLDSAA
jgi:hypothetical protein